VEYLVSNFASSGTEIIPKFWFWGCNFFNQFIPEGFWLEPFSDFKPIKGSCKFKKGEKEKKVFLPLAENFFHL